jgi:hypothetical protein
MKYKKGGGELRCLLLGRKKFCFMYIFEVFTWDF